MAFNKTLMSYRRSYEDFKEVFTTSILLLIGTASLTLSFIEASKAMKSVLSTTALFDVIVAMVSVPLLIIFGLLLESNMRGEWTQHEDTRWNVLALGLALLFVSLLVCCYVIHRLGICIWKAQNRDYPQRTQHNRSDVTSSTDSQLHLVVDGELPPSYASILSMDMPPAYCHVIMDGSLDKSTNHEEMVAARQNMTQR